MLENGYPYRKIKSDLHLIPVGKKTSKYIKDLNIKPKTMELLEEIIAENFMVEHGSTCLIPAHEG